MMMKHLLPLVLLSAISFPCITATGDDGQLIYDTDGHQLTSQSAYYILPAEKGTKGGGGLKPNWSRRPLATFVTQTPSEADHGDPVAFRPLSASSDGIIRLSTDNQIIFSIITTSLVPLYWYVPGRLASSEPHQRVAVREEHTEPRGFVFRVERHGVVAAGATKGYKLVWCHDGEMKPCRDLGLYESEGETWLATSDSPFVVVFKKRELA